MDLWLGLRKWTYCRVKRPYGGGSKTRIKVGQAQRKGSQKRRAKPSKNGGISPWTQRLCRNITLLEARFHLTIQNRCDSTLTRWHTHAISCTVGTHLLLGYMFIKILSTGIHSILSKRTCHGLSSALLQRAIAIMAGLGLGLLVGLSACTIGYRGRTLVNCVQPPKPEINLGRKIAAAQSTQECVKGFGQILDFDLQ